MKFQETMSGTWRRAGVDGAGPDGAISFDALAELPRLPGPTRSVVGSLRGTFHCEGLVSAAAAEGTIEVSPVLDRRIRYVLETTDDEGRACRFDGWKSIDWMHSLSTWTTLPGSIYGPEDELIGTAELRFRASTLLPFLASMRLRPGRSRTAGGDPALAPLAAAELERRRSGDTKGRLEVWYDTFTDPETKSGFWLHHELVTPADGSPAEARGWAAVFPADGSPEWHRFGPEPVEPGQYFSAGDVVAEPGRRWGSAGPLEWDLSYEDSSQPLYTFPRSTWRREILPGVQALPSPAALFSGKVRLGDRVFELDRAPGGAARIFGHGNAARWAWLHADLGGGDVLEVVAAVSHRPGLDRLRPLPLVQLRLGGEDWPANQLVAAPRFRCRVELPTWTVEGRVGGRRLRATVTVPPDRAVSIGYVDPDGSTATCTNSERADASIVVERVTGGSWRVEHEWRLEGTAHAEVGLRP
jgi:hypothetical protein